MDDAGEADDAHAPGRRGAAAAQLGAHRDEPARPHARRTATDPGSGLRLAVPEGWTDRITGSGAASRLVLVADTGPATGSRLVAVCLSSDEDVRVAGPAAATVLVAGRSGRVLDYGDWDGDGRSVLFATDAGDDGGVSLGRMWMISRLGMLTTITLLAPAHAWPAAEAAADVALSGLVLPAARGDARLTSSATPARLDPHLGATGSALEDLSALDDAQPRPLLGRRVGRASLAWLLRLPGGATPQPCAEVADLVEPQDGPGGGRDGVERPGAHPAGLRQDLVAAGLAVSTGEGLSPTDRGLVAARLLQTCERRIRVDVQEPDGAATAFVRVDADHLVLVTGENGDGDPGGPGLRLARSLRLHVAPAAALPVVLAGQLRLGPAWTLPMPELRVPEAALVRRWTDPAEPAPHDDVHLDALWAQPWSLVSLQWATAGETPPSGEGGARSRRRRERSPEGPSTRLLRAGARGWLEVRPDGDGTVVLSVVPVLQVWGLLQEIASAVRR